MNNFIQNIVSFIRSLNDGVVAGFRTIYGIDWVNNNYIPFLSKNIINGDLLNISITWGELFNILTVWTITILFIIFIFKLVSGVIRFFFIGK